MAKKKAATVEYKAPAEVEGNGNGHDKGGFSDEGYQQFLQELKDKGAIAEGNELAENGQQLLSATSEHRAAAVHYIASVGEAESVFPKDKLRARFLDQIARTVVTEEQHQALLDLYDWGMENKVEEAIEFCVLWATSAPSINGQSRRELVESVTTITQNLNSGSFRNDRNKPKSKRPLS